MYRQKLILALFLLATLFVSCNDNDEEEIAIAETYPVELSISFPEKETDFLYSSWDDHKRVVAFRTDTRDADKLVLTQSDVHTFLATSEKEITEYTEFAFLYPTSASTVSASDTLTQMLYVNKQDGTLDGLADLDYTWGTYTYDEDEEDYASTSVMTPLMSFCKFQFTEIGCPIERISQVIITSPTDSLHVVGELNLMDGSITSQNRGSVVVRNTQGLAGEVYVALSPTETSLHFTISTLDGKSYEAVLSEVVKFEAGETFVYTDIPCSVLKPARIGNYYYNDGTWSDALTEDKKCVGVVYALNDANGNLDKNLSESGHGRVVALQDCAEQVAWCITGEDIEGLENQTILRDTMYVGSLPYWKGTSDSFFSDDAQEQLGGVEINPATGGISAWYSVGALSDFDGQANTSQILSSTGTYYASTYCKDYGQGMYGWYLPSAGELALLWTLHRSGFIGNETHEVFEDFDEFGYWTSTEYDEGNVWYINFWSGMITKNSKASAYCVRPVILF